MWLPQIINCWGHKANRRKLRCEFNLCPCSPEGHSLVRGLTKFLCQGAENILGLAGHTVSVATTRVASVAWNGPGTVWKRMEVAGHQWNVICKNQLRGNWVCQSLTTWNNQFHKYITMWHMPLEWDIETPAESQREAGFIYPAWEFRERNICAILSKH